MEFGLRSRLGRTLELTRTTAAEVVVTDPDRTVALACDLHLTLPGQLGLEGGLPTPDRYGGCWSGCGCAAACGTGGWTPGSRKRASTST
ncbi:hypothetical protein AB0O67_24900 [Streptomyces sp. NPDC086077]|uniref:hypothetical protein n=1 Tax=Streptomyces sp. NPDC086077 TaxID=3154862 RepID=UPI00344294A7